MTGWKEDFSALLGWLLVKDGLLLPLEKVITGGCLHLPANPTLQYLVFSILELLLVASCCGLLHLTENGTHKSEREGLSTTPDWSSNFRVLRSKIEKKEPIAILGSQGLFIVRRGSEKLTVQYI